MVGIFIILAKIRDLSHPHVYLLLKIIFILLRLTYINHLINECMSLFKKKINCQILIEINMIDTI